jgi:hypothetical protein
VCQNAKSAAASLSDFILCLLQAVKNQFLPGCALLTPLALGLSPGFNSIPARAVERPAQFRRSLFWLLLKLVDFFVGDWCYAHVVI